MAKIKENYEYTKEILSMHLPHVVISPLEGTYLAWYDFSYYINEKDIKNFFQYKCNLAVGEAGKGHIRINLATERKIVEEAMNNIIKQLL